VSQALELKASIVLVTGLPLARGLAESLAKVFFPLPGFFDASSQKVRAGRKKVWYENFASKNDFGKLESDSRRTWRV
jgi:hypothetical protein